jgi:hypothetical protein
MKKTDTKASSDLDSRSTFNVEKLANKYRRFVDDMNDPKFAKDMEQSSRPQVGRPQREIPHAGVLVEEIVPEFAEQIKTESEQLIEQLRKRYENNQITSEDINVATALLQKANTASSELIDDLRNEVGLNKTNKL